MSGNDWWNSNVFSCRRKEERRCRLHVVWQSVPENGGCDRKRATASCWQTVLCGMCSCSVNDDRRRGDDLAGLIQAVSWLKLPSGVGVAEGQKGGGGEVMRDVYPLHAPRVKSRSGIFSCIGHIFNIIANCEKGGSGWGYVRNLISGGCRSSGELNPLHFPFNSPVCLRVSCACHTQNDNKLLYRKLPSKHLSQLNAGFQWTPVFNGYKNSKQAYTLSRITFCRCDVQFLWMDDMLVIVLTKNLLFTRCRDKMPDMYIYRCFLAR